MSGARRRAVLTGSAFSSRLAQWTQASVIKSLQTGTVTLAASASATATITAVDTSNAILFYGGVTEADNTNTTPQRWQATCVLTNSTTVTATKGAGGAGTSNAVFTVVEFFPGVIKSLQRGTAAIATSASTGTATITTVATGKSVLVPCGVFAPAGDNSTRPDSWAVTVVLTNATTVTATRIGSSASYSETAAFQVVEFV